MLKVILIGYGELASSLMLGVLESKHKLVGVLRWEKAKSNKIYSSLKDILWPDQFTSLVKAYKVPEIKANSANSKDFFRAALRLNPDVILVGSWGEILKKKTIMLPKIASVNCHPSLLPMHRGSNPYVSVIRQREAKTGITFHLMDEKLDTGHVLIQKEVTISNDDTGGSLRTKCSYTARQSVKELLDGLEGAKLLPQKQDEAKATYFPRLGTRDASIDWNNSAQEIYDQIRALDPWIKCYAKYKDQFLMTQDSKIIRLQKPVYEPGRVLMKKGRNLLVATGDSDNALLINNVGVYGFLSTIWSPYYIDSSIKAGDLLE